MADAELTDKQTNKQLFASQAAGKTRIMARNLGQIFTELQTAVMVPASNRTERQRQAVRSSASELHQFVNGELRALTLLFTPPALGSASLEIQRVFSEKVDQQQPIMNSVLDPLNDGEIDADSLAQLIRPVATLRVALRSAAKAFEAMVGPTITKQGPRFAGDFGPEGRF